MDNTDHHLQGRLRTRAHSRSTSPIRGTPYQPLKRADGVHRPFPRPLNQSNTSAWQQLVMHASSAAGTTAAVISEESMKCLKYCLSWLQYAIQHITQQMAVLRSLLVNLASVSSTNSTASMSTLVPPNRPSHSVLSSIKRDIVGTLRKVVDVISRYAGNSLPHHAKLAVRGFILNLPNRWATLKDIRSTSTSPATSPMLRPQENGSQSILIQDNPGQEESAIRLLNFGQESIEMLDSVSSVFSDTIERAELWLDRLRTVRGAPTAGGQEDGIRLPPIRTLNTNHEVQMQYNQSSHDFLNHDTNQP